MTTPEARPLSVCASPVVDYVEVFSIEELDTLLRQIAKECARPVLASVRRPDGDQMSIGLGHPYSVLTYVPADEFPPYLTSVGQVAPDQQVLFDYHGESSEFGRHNAVSLEQALEVMRQFAGSSGLPLPRVVDWEEI